EPDEEYVLPFGKGRVVQNADVSNVSKGDSICVITYGMGVYWSKNAAKNFEGKVEIIDLRTLVPLDEELVFETVKKHGKVLVVTEEPITNSFAQALCGRIQQSCFEYLDAPVMMIGARDLPAIGLSSVLESAMLPNAEKVGAKMEELLGY
ncbi:MAG TPA: transketolase C-terminal domain-containing protein, partial [Flavobacteriales bacterium]|nr:transketolase C-terminal domain-containing protein [Flavobacteriales bacterium]